MRDTDSDSLLEGEDKGQTAAQQSCCGCNVPLAKSVTWSQHTEVGESNEDEVLASFQTSVEEEMMVTLYNYLITDKFGHFVKVDNTLVSWGRRLFVSGTIEFLDEMRTM